MFLMACCSTCFRAACALAQQRSKQQNCWQHCQIQNLMPWLALVKERECCMHLILLQQMP
jgi:hypothetical protein